MSELNLSQSTIEKLGHYVYLLIDPFSKQPFYVGKGKGERIFAHVRGLSKKSEETSRKKEKIHEIISQGGEVEHLVLRHGLTKEEALEVESALIDFIGIENLTNKQRGHYFKKGKRTLEGLKLLYEAEEAVFSEPVVLININVNYREKMPYEEIYEATRKHWKPTLATASKYSTVCCVYRGIVREVFVVHEWLESDTHPDRIMFIGEQAPPEIRDKYNLKSVTQTWKPSGNPVRFLS